MVPSDYVNSKLTVNSHLECFAGSAAGLGCPRAFLTPPVLFFYSCYACRSDTKPWKYIKNTTPDWVYLPPPFHSTPPSVTGCVGERTKREGIVMRSSSAQKNTWHSNPKQSVSLLHREEKLSLKDQYPLLRAPVYQAELWELMGKAPMPSLLPLVDSNDTVIRNLFHCWARWKSEEEWLRMKRSIFHIRSGPVRYLSNC